MHEGVLCYLYWLNHYTPIYATCSEMPAETYLVYEYCLTTHNVKDDKPALMRVHEEAEKRFAQIGFFNMVDGTHPHSRALNTR